MRAVSSSAGKIAGRMVLPLKALVLLPSTVISNAGSQLGCVQYGTKRLHQNISTLDLSFHPCSRSLSSSSMFHHPPILPRRHPVHPVALQITRRCVSYGSRTSTSGPSLRTAGCTSLDARVRERSGSAGYRQIGDQQIGGPHMHGTVTSSS